MTADSAKYDTPKLVAVPEAGVREGVTRKNFVSYGLNSEFYRA